MLIVRISILLVFTFLSIFLQKSYAQKVTVSDIETLFASDDKGAEILMNKGFDVNIGKTIKFVDFRYEDGKELISINSDPKSDFSNRYLRTCYSKKFHPDFEKFKQFIISHGKKVDFYQSEYYHTYYLVYFYNFKYYHFGKGVCESSDGSYKYDSFFVIDVPYKF